MFTELFMSREFVLSFVLGVYILIMACVFLFRAHYYRPLIAQIKEPGAGIMFIGAVGLLMGVFLIFMHNIWVFEPRIFLTVFCWAFFVNALLWLVMPVYMLSLLKKLFSTKGYYVAIILMIALSGQLLSQAAYLYLHHPEVVVSLVS